MEQFLLGSLSRGFHFSNFFHTLSTSWSPFLWWPDCVLQARDCNENSLPASSFSILQIENLQILYPCKDIEISANSLSLCATHLLLSLRLSLPAKLLGFLPFSLPSCCSRCPLTFPAKGDQEM